MIKALKKITEKIKKFLEKLFDTMIKIGSTVINTIKVGQNTPDHIDVGSDRVWPDSIEYYLTLSPTTVLIMYGQQSGGTISVSSNTQNWSVEVSPRNSYITATKQDASSITWSIQENTGNTSRNAFITASYGSVSAETSIYQNNGYVIYIEGGNEPRTVGSGGTNNLAISVVSKHGSDAVAVNSASTQSWIQCTGMTNAGGGRYIFVFDVDANASTSERNATLTFSQSQGTKSTSILIMQSAKYVPTQISGFTMYAQDGEWMLGRYKSGTVQGPSGRTYDMYAIAILRATAFSDPVQASYDFDSSYGMPAPTTSQNYSGISNIQPSSTVTIPGGGTGYGAVIAQAPQLQPPANITFSVSAL